MPFSIWCAAPSTTTMASSTTMPIASTIANSVDEIDVKPSAAIAGERADDGDRHGRRRHQHGAPVLQEDQDHDEHQHAGLDQRLVDLVDRLRRRTWWCRTECRRSRPCGNAFASSSIFASTTLLRPPARWRRATGRSPMPAAGLPFEREDLAVGLRAEFDPADVAHAGDRRRWSPVLTIDVLELARRRRAGRLTLSVYWNACPLGAGGMPTWPAVTCWLCCCDRVDDVLRHRDRAPAACSGRARPASNTGRRRTR